MRFRRPVAALTTAVLVLVACGGDSPPTTAAGSPTPAPTQAAEKRGGSIVVAAEQWPLCVNPITQCGSAAIGRWILFQQVLPRLVNLGEHNEYVAGNLIEELPSVANGGVTTNPFTVTFKLRPDAVWDDGTPITSADVQFTWEASRATRGSTQSATLDVIEAIDTPDPRTAVVRFRRPAANWRVVLDYVLKKSAFTAPDLSEQMQSAIPFSGGPWKLESFSAEQAVLVPNPSYWLADERPRLEKVTLVPRTEPDTGINQLVGGQVAAIVPQPSLQISKKLQAPNVEFTMVPGPFYEAMWFNVTAPPLDDADVRRALMLAVNREAIVDAVVKPDAPSIGVLDCPGHVSTAGPWCDKQPYSTVKHDVAEAKRILEADGWSLGGDGVYAKGGTRLDLEISTVAGNVRREDTQQLVIQQAKAAGIALRVRNDDAGTLFQTRVPRRDFQVLLSGRTVGPEPLLNFLFNCDQVGTEANGFAGQNNTGWCNPEASRLLDQSDEELDEAVRVGQIQRVMEMVRDEAVMLPLFQLPSVTAWRTDKVAGPIDSYGETALSSYYTINRWHLP